MDTATAPAQEVILTDQLDITALELSTFSLGPISFGGFFLVPPAGLTHYSTDVDLRPGRNLIVRINAGVDATGLATWRFTSLDPATMLPTADPLAGFLPPNVTSPEGQGSVLFTVKPRPNLPTGIEIHNKATIVFDTNAAITTPEWFNTIDNDKPLSHVGSLPVMTTSTDFVVQWAGADLGAGIQDYTVFASEDGGPFAPFVTNTTDTSATFSGQVGKTYAFYSVARDLVGNVEDAKSVGDATTQVVAPDTTPPVITLFAPADGTKIASLSATVTGTVTDDGNVATLTINGAAVARAADGRFSTLIALAPGANSITVFASDTVGNSTIVTRSVRANVVPPALALGAPPNDLVTSVSSVMVHGTATPADAQDLVSVTVQGNAVSVQSDGSFSASVALTAGVNLITAVATDGYGLQATAAVNVALDAVPPQITVSGVQDGQVSNAPVVAPVYSASDTYLASMTALLDGAPFASGTSVSAEGLHQLVVTATDLAGNASRVQLNFAIDRTPPAIIVNGANDGQFSNAPVVLTFSATDANLASVTGMLDGAPFASGSKVGGEGSHLLIVTATDLAGNESRAQVRFTVDVTPPQIALFAPADGTRIAALSVTISGRVSDANALSQTTINGVPTALAPDGTFSALVSLTPGANTITAVAVDAAGNVSTASRHVRANVVPPALTVTEPTNGLFTSTSNVQVLVTATPADASDAVTVMVQGQAASLQADGTFGAVVPLVNGPNVIAVIATDGYGLQTTSNVSVVLDATPPQIALSGVLDGQVSNAAFLAPTFVATDAHLGAIAATLDGLAFVSGTPVSAEGMHLLVVSATDLAGNQSRAQVRFTLDRTPPTITGTRTPAPNGNGWNNSPVTVAFQCSDALSGLAAGSPTAPVILSTNGAGMSALGTCIDLAGNTASLTVAPINIDLVAPVLTAPPNQVVPQTSPAGATVSYPPPMIGEAGSGLASSACAPASGSVFPVGLTTVICTATDSAGNTGSTTFTVTVNAFNVTSDGRMVGVGFIDAGGRHDHFAFRVSQIRSRDFGRFEFWANDPERCEDDDRDRDEGHNGDRDDEYGRDHHRPQSRFEATAISEVTFTDDPAFQPGRSRQPVVDMVRFSGAGEWNGHSGYTFEVVATDRGEPGRHRDTFSLTVKDGAGNTVVTVSGSLDGGDIQSTGLAK